MTLFDFFSRNWIYYVIHLFDAHNNKKDDLLFSSVVDLHNNIVEWYAKKLNELHWESHMVMHFACHALFSNDSMDEHVACVHIRKRIKRH